MDKLFVMASAKMLLRKKNGTDITRVLGTVPGTIHNPNRGKQMDYVYTPRYK